MARHIANNGVATGGQINFANINGPFFSDDKFEVGNFDAVLNDEQRVANSVFIDRYNFYIACNR